MSPWGDGEEHKAEDSGVLNWNHHILRNDVAFFGQTLETCTMTYSNVIYHIICS